MSNTKITQIKPNELFREEVLSYKVEIKKSIVLDHSKLDGVNEVPSLIRDKRTA